jgi:outer membrane protein W
MINMAQQITVNIKIQKRWWFAAAFWACFLLTKVNFMCPDAAANWLASRAMRFNL